MHFTLVSISRKALEFTDIEWVTIPTRDGEITILPNHEPLITALVPGILIVRANSVDTSYAIGGGVAEITAKNVIVTADMVEDGTDLDIEAIRIKKEEAGRLLEEYKSKGETIDMEVYIDLEQQFLKESAKEQLSTR